MLALGFRNLLSRRLRSFLSVLAVALGVGLVLGTQLAASALESRSEQVAQGLFGSADLDVRALAKQGLTPQMVSAIQALPSVGDSTAQLSKQTAADIRGERSFVLIEGIDLAAEGRFHSLDLAAGTWFADSDTAGVVLAQPFAAEHGLRVGDHLKLVTITGFDDFKVVGILQPGGLGQLNSGQAIFISLTTARRLFALGGRVQQVEVKLAPGTGISTFRSQLAAVATQDYYVLDRSSVIGDPAVLLRGLAPVAIGLGLLSLLVALLLVSNTLAMEVLERRRDIGVLRAAGATGRQVGSIFAVQAASIGLLGGLLGVGVGLVLAVVAAALIGAQAGLGPVQISVPAWEAVVIVAGGMLLTLLAASVAMGRAAALAPLAALRPGFALERGGRPVRSVAWGALGLLAGAALIAGSIPALQVLGTVLVALAFAILVPVYIGPLLRLVGVPVRGLAGAEGLLALRALLRRRTRTTLTVGGVGLATAALVALAGLSASAQAAGEDWVGSLFVSRYLVVSPLDQPLSVADVFTGLPGVLTASPVSSFSVRTGSTALPAVAVEPEAYGSGGGLRLVSGGGPAAAGLSGNSVLLPYSLARQLGVGAGSTLPIETEQGQVSFRVAGVLYHSLPGSNGQESAVFSQATAARRFGVDFFDVLQIVPSGGSLDLHALRQAALSYGMDVVTVDQISRAVGSGLAGLTLALQALGLVGVAVAVLGLVNTMVVSVVEERRELALLRSIGMTRRQLRRLVLAEAAMLGLGGALLGVVLGAVGLAGLLRATATPAFQPAVVVPWAALAVIAGGLLAASLLAALVPARQAARGSILDALRTDY